MSFSRTLAGKMPLALFILAILLFIASVVMFFTGLTLFGYISIATGCTLLFVWVIVLSMRIGKSGEEE
ncbi:MAG TPA: hypothetical protein O0X39_03770 [Methanocorpusculum sp.]|nr:hypothetical protein [Methanocorpusculum sp.]